MNSDHDLWKSIVGRLSSGRRVVLLVVAESSGSSPGRPGYKMAITQDGELTGSIGGGVMEVNLVNGARTLLSSSPQSGEFAASTIRDQVHRKAVPNSSGMICSGKQTVLFKLLSLNHLDMARAAQEGVQKRDGSLLVITPTSITVQSPQTVDSGDISFTRRSDSHFEYRERLGAKNDLYIIGGGHCALALSELMSKLDFHIMLFDDRPQLNTIEKNDHADDIRVIDSYEQVGKLISSGDRAYVVVMTLGYKTDALVIRQLTGKDFKYFGVLGSKAKMAALFRELIADGIPKDRLDKIHTPIGLPISSHSPEEIAISIAAEIISVKNQEKAP
jgi:xanthine dehydrogenase accessory factor